MQKKNIRFRCWSVALLLLRLPLLPLPDDRWHTQNNTLWRVLQNRTQDHNETTWKELFSQFFMKFLFLATLFFTLILFFSHKKVQQQKSLVQKGQGISRFCSLFTYPFFRVSKERKQTKNNIKRSNFSLIRNRRNLDFLLHFFFIFS